MLPLVGLFSILLASTPTGAPSQPPSRPTPAPSAAISPDQLFSRRALRQARLLIQMRMLQLRDERLECVRQALLRQLPDALWPEEPTPSRGTANVAAAVTRCAELLKF